MSMLNWNVPVINGQDVFFTKESHDCYSYYKEPADFKQFLQERESALDNLSSQGGTAKPKNETAIQGDGAVTMEARYPVSSGHAHGAGTTPSVHLGGQVSRQGKTAGPTVVHKPGKVLVAHGQQSIHFPRKSWLTHQDQRRYLELYHKYTNFPPIQPTQEELIEMNILKELQTRVIPEQEEFMSYLEQVAEKSRESYSYIHPQAKQYVEEKVTFMHRRVKDYPRHYQNMDTVPLSIPPDLRQFPPLVHVKALLELGQIPKVILPNMTCGARPYLPTDYTKVSERVPPIPPKVDGPRVWNKEVCSQDWNAEVLAQKYGCNVVISSAGLKCLLDNYGPEFDRTWDMPVVVKEYEVSDNGRKFIHKVVFLDKPFVNRCLNVRQRNAMFHKAALKTLISHPEKGHKFGVRRNEPVTATKPLPVKKDSAQSMKASSAKQESSKKSGPANQKSSADDLFGAGDVGMEDLETFGMSSRVKDIHRSFVGSGTYGKKPIGHVGSDSFIQPKPGILAVVTADPVVRKKAETNILPTACTSLLSVDDTSRSSEGHTSVCEDMHAENRSLEFNEVKSETKAETKEMGKLFDMAGHRSWPARLEICQVKPENSSGINQDVIKSECSFDTDSVVDRLQEADTCQEWLSETEVECLESSMTGLQEQESRSSKAACGRAGVLGTKSVESEDEMKEVVKNSFKEDSSSRSTKPGSGRAGEPGMKSVESEDQMKAVVQDSFQEEPADALEAKVTKTDPESQLKPIVLSSSEMRDDADCSEEMGGTSPTVTSPCPSQVQENPTTMETGPTLRRRRGRPRKVKAVVGAKSSSTAETEASENHDVTVSADASATALGELVISPRSSRGHQKCDETEGDSNKIPNKATKKEDVTDAVVTVDMGQRRRQSLRTASTQYGSNRTNPVSKTELSSSLKAKMGTKPKASFFSSEDSSQKDTSEDEGGRLVIDASPEDEPSCKMTPMTTEKSQDDISEDSRPCSSSTPIKSEVDDVPELKGEPKRQIKMITESLPSETTNQENPNGTTSDEEDSALVIDDHELINLSSQSRSRSSSRAGLPRRRSPRILAQVSDSTDAEGDNCPPQKRGRRTSTGTCATSVSEGFEETMPRRRSGRLSNTSPTPESGPHQMTEDVGENRIRPPQRKRGRPPKRLGQLGRNDAESVVQPVKSKGVDETRSAVLVHVNDPSIQNEGIKEHDGIASPENVRRNLSEISEIQEPSDMSEIEMDAQRPVIIPLSPQYHTPGGHGDMMEVHVPVPMEVPVTPSMQNEPEVSTSPNTTDLGILPDADNRTGILPHKKRRRSRESTGLDKPNPFDAILQMQERMLHSPTCDAQPHALTHTQGTPQLQTETPQGNLNKGQANLPLGQLQQPLNPHGQPHPPQGQSQPHPGHHKENPADFIQPTEHLNVTYHLWSFAGKPLLIRCGCHGFRREINQQLSYMGLCTKLEYQPLFGVEQVTRSEAIRNWATAYIRQNCPLIRARINAFTSELTMLEELDVSRIVPSVFAALPAQGLNLLHSVLSKLEGLSAGHYLMTHSKGDNYCHLRRSGQGNKRGDYDLHFSYTGFTSAESAAEVNVPWIPIDTAVLLPHHWKTNRIPATFEPPDYVGPQKGKQGASGQQNNSKKKKKNRGKNKKK